MRLLRNKMGVVRVIEAFLASIILMSCIALIPSSSPVTSSTGGNLSSTAQNALLSLDSNGHLANLVDNRNWTALQDAMQSVLPLTVWFNLTVFDRNMNVLNNYPICNAGTLSNNIVSVNYICASQNSTYTYYILQLQLSQVGSP